MAGNLHQLTRRYSTWTLSRVRDFPLLINIMRFSRVKIYRHFWAIGCLHIHGTRMHQVIPKRRLTFRHTTQRHIPDETLLNCKYTLPLNYQRIIGRFNVNIISMHPVLDKKGYNSTNKRRYYVRSGVPGGAVGWGYKSEVRGFDSRWCHWNFSLTILPAALWSIQSLTEMSTRNFLGGGVKAASAWGWQLYHLPLPIVLKFGSLNLLEPSVAVQACNGTALICTVD